MPTTPKNMVKILEQNGFKVVSTNGSHCKLKNSAGKIVIVPMHCKDLKKGTEINILKQAGLNHQ